jgi:hypothetical protein
VLLRSPTAEGAEIAEEKRCGGALLDSPQWQVKPESRPHSECLGGYQVAPRRPSRRSALSAVEPVSCREWGLCPGLSSVESASSSPLAPASGPLDRRASHSPLIPIFGLPDELAHAAILYDEGHALHAVIELESVLREGRQAMLAATAR